MRRAILAFLLLCITALPAFSALGKKEIRIRLIENSTHTIDEIRIFLDLGVRQFSAAEDAQKVFDSTSSAPFFYSFSGDGVPCYSNSYGTFVNDMVVPLGIKVAGNSDYTFEAVLIDNYDATSIIRLEDRTDGIMHEMRLSPYTINIAQAIQDDGRFFLHVSFPSQITTTDAGCQNDDGAVSVSQDNSITWTSWTILDDTLGTVFSNGFVTGNFTYVGLPGGNYNLLFSYGQYSALKPVTVNARNIENSITASTLYATTGQSIQFFSNTTNTNYFLWQFGDGSEITGVANPDFAYLQPGTYTVTLTCSNIYGCMVTTQMTVYITQATGIENLSDLGATVNVQNRNLLIQFNRPVEQRMDFQLLNSLGQLVNSASLSNHVNQVDL
jgi:hypothetical protein